MNISEEVLGIPLYQEVIVMSKLIAYTQVVLLNKVEENVQFPSSSYCNLPITISQLNHSGSVSGLNISQLK